MIIWSADLYSIADKRIADSICTPIWVLFFYKFTVQPCRLLYLVKGALAHATSSENLPNMKTARNVDSKKLRIRS
jgi:hypothetical protein